MTLVHKFRLLNFFFEILTRFLISVGDFEISGSILCFLEHRCRDGEEEEQEDPTS